MSTWVCYHVIGDALRGSRRRDAGIRRALSRRARRRADGACAAATTRRARRRRVGGRGDRGGGQRRRLGRADHDVGAADRAAGDRQRSQAVGVRPATCVRQSTTSICWCIRNTRRRVRSRAYGPYLRAVVGQRAGCAPIGSLPWKSGSESVGTDAERACARRRGCAQRRVASLSSGPRPAAFAQDAARLAAARGHGRASAQLRRHDRLSSTPGASRRRAWCICSTPSGEVRKVEQSRRAGRRRSLRNNEQIRCYYPDAKVIRVEPRTVHNAFPSLLPQQLNDACGVLHVSQGRDRARRRPRDAGVRLRAQGRVALRPQILGRYRDRAAAQGAAAQRKDEPRSSSSRSATSRSASSSIATRSSRRSRRRRPTGRCASRAGRRRRRRTPAGWSSDLPPGFTKIVEGYRTLHGKPAPVVALRLFGRAGRDFGVRRTDAGDAAAGRSCRSRAASTSTAGSSTIIWSPCWAKRPARPCARSRIRSDAVADFGRRLRSTCRPIANHNGKRQR